jgi:hypothetical protein
MRPNPSHGARLDEHAFLVEEAICDTGCDPVAYGYLCYFAARLARTNARLLAALTAQIRQALPNADDALQVRKAPSRPRSWANLSLLPLYSRRNAQANLQLLGQPNTVLAAGERLR